MHAGGPYPSDSQQVEPDPGAGHSPYPGLATPSLARGSNSASIHDTPTASAAGGGLDSTEGAELEVAPSGAPSQHGVLTRAAARTLRDGGVEMVTRRAGSSTAAQHTADLVYGYAWSGRTEASRKSQWNAWLQFCQEDDRNPLPVTEAHLLAFIGWLKSSREAGTRRVGSSSIPQYLSAVRTMHQLFIGTPVPRYQFVDVVRRA